MGGLIGNGDNVVVKNCYRFSAQKIIGNVVNDFGMSLSSKDMKTHRSFVNWDFENIWVIDPNKNGGFPYLLSVEPVIPNSIPTGEESLFESFWVATLLIVVIVLVVSVVYLLLKNRLGNV